MVENGDGTFWAQPDNGFGTKANSADFLLRLYQVRPHWETARRRRRRDRGRAVHLAARPRPPDRLPDRQRGHARPAADRRRLRHRVAWSAPRTARSGSARSSGRSCCTSTPTAGCCRRRCPFPDGKSPQNPYLGRGRAAPDPGEPRVRGDGRPPPTAATSTRSSRARSSTTPTSAAAGSTSSTPAPARYTGRTWAYQVDEAPTSSATRSWSASDRLLVHRAGQLRRPRGGDQAASTRSTCAATDADGFVAKTLRRRPAARSPTPTTSARPPRPVLRRRRPVLLPDGLRRDRRRSCATAGCWSPTTTTTPATTRASPGTPDDTEMVVIDLRRTRAPEPRRRARDRAPRLQRLPARAHAGVLRAGHPGRAPTTSSPTWSRPRTACWSPGTRTRSAAPPTSPPARSSPTDGRPRSSTASPVTGWFTEDFTLAELKTLRAEGADPRRAAGEHRLRRALRGPDPRRGARPGPPLPHLRRAARSASTPRPSTRRTSTAIGLSLEEPLLATLAANGYDDRRPGVHPELRDDQPARARPSARTSPLVQLADCTGAPYDLVVAGDPTTYADLVTAPGCRRSRRYADGLGACKDLLIPRDADGRLLHADAGDRRRPRGRPGRAPLHVPAWRTSSCRRSSAAAPTRTRRRPGRRDPRLPAGRASTASSPTTPRSAPASSADPGSRGLVSSPGDTSPPREAAIAGRPAALGVPLANGSPMVRRPPPACAAHGVTSLASSGRRNLTPTRTLTCVHLAAASPQPSPLL